MSYRLQPPRLTPAALLLTLLTAFTANCGGKAGGGGTNSPPATDGGLDSGAGTDGGVAAGSGDGGAGIDGGVTAGSGDGGAGTDGGTQSFSIGGIISGATTASQVVLSLASCGASACVEDFHITTAATTNVDASGHYAFSGLSDGNYRVTPSSSTYVFYPALSDVLINSQDVEQNFTALAPPNIAGTWTGKVTFANYSLDGMPSSDLVELTIIQNGTLLSGGYAGLLNESGLFSGTLEGAPSATSNFPESFQLVVPEVSQTCQGVATIYGNTAADSNGNLILYLNGASESVPSCGGPQMSGELQGSLPSVVSTLAADSQAQVGQPFTVSMTIINNDSSNALLLPCMVVGGTATVSESYGPASAPTASSFDSISPGTTLSGLVWSFTPTTVGQAVFTASAFGYMTSLIRPVSTPPVTVSVAVTQP